MLGGWADSRTPRRPSVELERRGAGIGKGSDDSTTLDDADHNDDEGNDQQNVDEPAQRIAADQAQKPENDENRSNGLEHLVPLSGQICGSKRDAAPGPHDPSLCKVTMG
jgi:hypothetical protein